MVKKIGLILVLIVAECVLIKLGLWQLDRLETKIFMEKSIAIHESKDPTETPLNLDNGPVEFERGRISGQFMFSVPPIFVGPRTMDGQSGYHVLQAFQMVKGPILLINRGWVSNEERAEAVTLPQVEWLGGYLSLPQKPSMGGENIPEDNIWYWADVQQIQTQYNLPPIFPAVLKQEASALPFTDTMPKPFSGLPQLRNNHIQYALFWFFMAGLLVVLMGIRALKPR